MSTTFPIDSQRLKAVPVAGQIPRLSALSADAGSTQNGTGLMASEYGGNGSNGGLGGNSEIDNPAEDGISLRLPPNLARMPVGLSVAVPIREFRVHKLLSIKSGDVIQSNWNNGEDLPLISGNVQLAWAEFEVVETRLAVRVTRLA